MRPLFFAPARPMKEEWKINPYLGVLPRVLSARNSAFSAPRIWWTRDWRDWRDEIGEIGEIGEGARVGDGNQ